MSDDNNEKEEFLIWLEENKHLISPNIYSAVKKTTNEVNEYILSDDVIDDAKLHATKMILCIYKGKKEKHIHTADIKGWLMTTQKLLHSHFK